MKNFCQKGLLDRRTETTPRGCFIYYATTPVLDDLFTTPRNIAPEAENEAHLEKHTGEQVQRSSQIEPIKAISVGVILE
jgi:hypothetical protein